MDVNGKETILFTTRSISAEKVLNLGIFGKFAGL
jgi:hypothetical protein